MKAAVTWASVEAASLRRRYTLKAEGLSQPWTSSLKFFMSVYKVSAKLLQTGLRAQVEQKGFAYAETLLHN